MTSRIWARTENLFYRHVEESSGNDPQSVSHRSHCLANKSRRLQGLLSIVLIIGLEPITSDVSGRRSHHWAIWAIRYFSREEPICHFLLDSCGLLTRDVTTGEPNIVSLADKEGLEPSTTRLTVEGSTIELLVHFVVGADGIEPPSRCFTDTSRTLPILPFVHSTGFEPVTCCM